MKIIHNFLICSEGFVTIGNVKDNIENRLDENIVDLIEFLNELPIDFGRTDLLRWRNVNQKSQDTPETLAILSLSLLVIFFLFGSSIFD